MRVAIEMKNILQISEASSLGLHAMACLASYEGQSVTTKYLAEKLNGSSNHLSKIMQRLVKAGLVSSIRGPKGGFFLAADADDITLLDVYEAIEGRFNQVECLLSDKICRGGSCILGEALQETNKAVYDQLKNTRLSDLKHVLK